jgi:hypothetical protein
MAMAKRELTPEEEWRYAEPAMRWYGWGSPVGAGLFVLAASIAASLIRYAFWG